jgi:hypothetical protein
MAGSATKKLSLRIGESGELIRNDLIFAKKNFKVLELLVSEAALRR